MDWAIAISVVALLLSVFAILEGRSASLIADSGSSVRSGEAATKFVFVENVAKGSAWGVEVSILPRSPNTTAGVKMKVEGAFHAGQPKREVAFNDVPAAVLEDEDGYSIRLTWRDRSRPWRRSSTFPFDGEKLREGGPLIGWA